MFGCGIDGAGQNPPSGTISSRSMFVSGTAALLLAPRLLAPRLLAPRLLAPRLLAPGVNHWHLAPRPAVSPGAHQFMTADARQRDPLLHRRRWSPPRTAPPRGAGTAAGGLGQRPRPRPMISFMISVVPPKMVWARPSANALATGYSRM